MNLRRLVLLLLVCVAPAVPAADVSDLYVGEAPVADQSRAEREEALETALGEVLVRITGDPDIARREAAADLLARAPDWVQRYGYQQDDDGNLRLQAKFDSGAVERALREAGLPVWGRERPRTLVLLAVEGEADILSSHAADELADAMLETARRRGVPLVFPARDGAERRQLREADIRYGNLDATGEAAQKYDASHVLVGRVGRVDGGWRGQWTLSQRGETVSEWTGGAADRERLFADATRRLADTYARRFAVYGGARADTVVAVAVDGVGALEEYARIGRYLRELTSVETAIPVLVDREAVVFRVQINGDPGVLERSIALAGWLDENELARNLAGLYAAGGHALGYRLGS